jgi:hypothetical protein
MKTPRYLSPTSIGAWDGGIENFYKRYLADNAPDREPQTQPMSVGSAFDAMAKSYLHYALYGNYGENDEYRLDVIFENQVEEHNRSWAWDAGKRVWEVYQKSGALADLMLDLQKAGGSPRFESTIEQTIDGIPFLGKPDILYQIPKGEQSFRVVHDWKVNGYCSARGVSPKAGYLKLFDRGSSGYPKVTQHKNCQPLMSEAGIVINGATYFENVDKDWARQLSIYAWLGSTLDGGPGCCQEPFIAAIDQIVCRNGEIRVACHRGIVSASFQEGLLQKAREIWETIQSGYIFRELELHVSKAKQDHLDGIGLRPKLDRAACGLE